MIRSGTIRTTHFTRNHGHAGIMADLTRRAILSAIRLADPLCLQPLKFDPIGAAHKGQEPPLPWFYLCYPPGKVLPMNRRHPRKFDLIFTGRLPIVPLQESTQMVERFQDG